MPVFNDIQRIDKIIYDEFINQIPDPDVEVHFATSLEDVVEIHEGHTHVWIVLWIHVQYVLASDPEAVMMDAAQVPTTLGEDKIREIVKGMVDRFQLGRTHLDLEKMFANPEIESTTPKTETTSPDHQ